MNEVVPQIWDVWHARFNYDGGRGYKYHPVIIVGTKEGGALVMMVTSSTNRLHLEHDYFLLDWEAAGLRKPSIARIDRIAEVPVAYFGTAGRIGRLSSRDAEGIVSILAAVSR